MEFTRVPRTDPDPAVQLAYGQAEDLFGHVSDLFAILGNAPVLLSGWIELVRALREGLTVAPALSELVIVRVAELTGSPYVGTAHRRLAAGLEPPPEHLAAAARRLAEDVARDGHVAEDALGALRGELGERQLTELLVVAAFYCGVARLTNTLGPRNRSAP
ncbi:carboxymuconolactone decarboxylase family protein [Dactylosporangium sp. CS-033363]|uniref:carboxymuconolactone decarboxylase family protein n=1 Tax=Dactylosporangium sp. CS-033363 TaxID=3239935 RepID=UPI003D8CD39A